MCKSYNNKLYLYVIIFLISFLANSIISIQWPRTGGDWDAYGTVAENIYEGHGVSLSKAPPYEPAFGGNSFPGYPAFIALIWLIFGKNYMAVRIAQSFVLAVSISIFSYVADKTFNNRPIGTFFGFFTAISPLTIAWSRSLQVEALSMASVVLFFSLIFLSFKEKKVRVLLISLSILWATFLRTDGVLLLVPLIALFFIKDISRRELFKKLLLIFMIVSSGIGFWLIRNKLVSMKNIFPPPVLLLGENHKVFPPPYGYLLWGWTWMSKEYERGGWGFPITRTGYDSIYIAPAAYENEKEKILVEKLLDELKGYKGQAFPRHVDNQFKDLAIRKIKQNPFKVFVVLPLKRMGNLWFHPGSSTGWPLEMTNLSYEERTRFERNYISGGLYLIKKYPVKILGKGAIFITTLLVQLAGLIGLYFLLKSEAKVIGIAILAYFFIRTGFYSLTNNVESRYMSQILPLLQFLSMYALITIYMKFKPSHKG